jgi:hypothetical protein
VPPGRGLPDSPAEQYEARRMLSRDQLDELAGLDVPVLPPIPTA